MKKHNKYINRTFYLAEKGLGYVLSNPLVGCVIVKNNEIIGEGFHQKYGEAHAEINAINSIKDKKQIKGSSIYINLEPCSHHGKTPPCVNSLIKFEPKEVIISNIDPNPSVNGRGKPISIKAAFKLLLIFLTFPTYISPTLNLVSSLS